MDSDPSGAGGRGRLRPDGRPPVPSYGSVRALAPGPGAGELWLRPARGATDLRPVRRTGGTELMARSPAEELDVDGTPVRLSNPDKIYFPQLGEKGGRKRDLVGYYRAVALQGALLTALRDRP